MKSIIKTVLPAGIVGGAVAGLFIWADSSMDATAQPLLFLGTGAMTALVLAALGGAIGLVFSLIFGSAYRLVVVLAHQSDDWAYLLAPTALVVAVAVLVARSYTSTNSMIGVIYLTAIVALLTIAAAAFLHSHSGAVDSYVILARWTAVLAGALAFFIGLRYLRASGGSDASNIVIATVAGVVVGAVVWGIGVRIVRFLSARTSSSTVVALGCVLLIGVVVALAPLSLLPYSQKQIVRMAADIPDTSATRSEPNIILISVDTLRADFVGYMTDKVRTPAMDALAAESYVFEQAYSIAPWTRPSFASFMTSLYPSEMGVGWVWGSAEAAQGYVPYHWREDRTLLSEIFKNQGYATGGIVTNENITREAHADQGFDFFYHCARMGPTVSPFLEDLAMMLTGPHPWMGTPHAKERARRVSHSAARFMEASDKRPLFLWLHYMDPHYPYSAPTQRQEQWSGGMWNRQPAGAAWGMSREHALNSYTAEVEYFDTWLADVIENLKRNNLWDSSVVVFWSDHGEEFWEHGAFGHGQSLHGELLHVPLLIHLPGQSEKRIIEQPVTLLDPMPTIMDYCDLNVSGDMHGTSLLALMNGEAVEYTCEAFLEGCYRGGRLRKGLMHGRWSLIYDSYLDQFSLYDVVNDPMTAHDLYGTELAPNTEQMEQKLMKWIEDSRAMMLEHVSRGEFEEISPGIDKNLKDMGYIQ